MNTKTINQTTILDCTPQAAYNAWMDSLQHGEMTGSSAKIDPKEGGKFSAWDGYIQGKTLELDPIKHKIVQVWRSDEQGWPKDYFSKVTIEFLPHTTNQTKIVFKHSGVPQENVKDIEQGWNDFYWTPMQKYFSSKL